MSLLPLITRRAIPETDLNVDFNSNMTSLPASLTGVSATFTRGSTRYRKEGNLWVSKSNNVFFTELDSITGKYGYTPEPAATNQLLRSNELNFPWVYNNMNSGPTNISSPTSAVAESCIYLNGFAGTSFVAQNGATVNGANTFSIYYRYSGIGTGTAWPHWALRIMNINSTTVGVTQWINVSTNTLGSVETGSGSTPIHIGSTIERLGTSDWWRVSVTFTANAAVVSARIYCVTSDNVLTNSSPTRSCVFRQAQLESGYKATSIITTVASTVTRAADVLSVPYSNIAHSNIYKMTMMTNFRKNNSVSDIFDLMSVNDGTALSQATLRLNSNNLATLRVNSTDNDGSTVLNTTEHKFAASLQGFSKLRSQDGVSESLINSIDMPSAINSLNIGHNLGLKQSCAYIFRSRFITNTRSQSQINSMTA